MPVAKRPKESGYKTPHWIPAVMCRGEAWAA